MNAHINLKIFFSAFIGVAVVIPYPVYLFVYWEFPPWVGDWEYSQRAIWLFLCGFGFALFGRRFT